jgi:hypothetical protein
MSEREKIPFSYFCASSKLRKITPTKKLRKKNDPIKMKKMKK